MPGRPLKEGELPHKLVGLLLIVLLAMAPVVAACGGGGASSPKTVAPDFTAQEAGGGQVTLSEALQESDKVVLVFYRGVF